MTSGKILVMAAFAASSAFAHPVSPDSLLPAPTRGPAMKRFANPDYLPGGTIDAASMGHPVAARLASDPHVITIQKMMAGRAGFNPGECGTLLVMTGRYGNGEPAMIAQTFRVNAAPTGGLTASRINSSLSTTGDDADPVKWLNAHDYEYRLPTQDFYVSGVPVRVAIGKLKTCPR